MVYLRVGEAYGSVAAASGRGIYTKLGEHCTQLSECISGVVGIGCKQGFFSYQQGKTTSMKWTGTILAE